MKSRNDSLNGNKWKQEIGIFKMPIAWMVKWGISLVSIFIIIMLLATAFIHFSEKVRIVYAKKSKYLIAFEIVKKTKNDSLLMVRSYLQKQMIDKVKVGQAVVINYPEVLTIEGVIVKIIKSDSLKCFHIKITNTASNTNNDNHLNFLNLEFRAEIIIEKVSLFEHFIRSLKQSSAIQ